MSSVNSGLTATRRSDRCRFISQRSKCLACRSLLLGADRHRWRSPHRVLMMVGCFVASWLSFSLISFHRSPHAADECPLRSASDAPERVANATRQLLTNVHWTFVK
eukprot:3390592-Rhodomonas_salina.1